MESLSERWAIGTKQIPPEWVAGIGAFSRGETGRQVGLGDECGRVIALQRGDGLREQSVGAEHRAPGHTGNASLGDARVDALCQETTTASKALLGELLKVYFHANWGPVKDIGTAAIRS